MNRVKELRARSGMQQKELALLVGVSKPTVSDWEHNKKNPAGENLKKLTEIFNVSTGVILGYEEVPRVIAEGEIVDDDVWEVREQLRRSPDMRVLFDAASKATPEQLRAAAAMLKAFQPGDEE